VRCSLGLLTFPVLGLRNYSGDISYREYADDRADLPAGGTIRVWICVTIGLEFDDANSVSTDTADDDCDVRGTGRDISRSS
jgi:hypothetical protein